MAYFHFQWTDEVVDHLDQHGISRDDFEGVVCGPVGKVTSDSSGLPAVFGYTADGRYIIAVYEMLDELTVLPVTAYEVDEPA